MSEQLQIQTGIRLGIDYPHPIVDHAFARERTLEAYRLAKEHNPKKDMNIQI
jgi:deoxyribodipyrimidine photolyase